MSTQMSMARRGLATEEMIQVAKDEDVDLSLWILSRQEISPLYPPYLLLPILTKGARFELLLV